MFIPVACDYRSEKSPWQVYQSVYSRHAVSFFLDSHAYQPPAQRYSCLGFAPFLELIVSKGRLNVRQAGKVRRMPQARFFLELRRCLKKYRLPAGLQNTFCGGAVGYLGYEMAQLFEPVRFRRKKIWPGIPDAYFGFYRDFLIYDHKLKRYRLLTHVQAASGKISAQQKKAAAEVLTQLARVIETPAPEKAVFQVEHFRPRISRPVFRSMVRKAKNYIAAGDIYQANLSQRFAFGYKGRPLALYGALRQINPSPFASFLKIDDLNLLSSSPERLISKRGSHCETKPIAGTRPRMAGRRGLELERQLSRSEKERAEHLMLVDLERNDLGRVCRWPTVKVREFMRVEKYSHVIHLVSRITGTLEPGRDAVDLLQALFPGGTITGCPKIRCMEIIDELEPETRGIYTGSLGYLDYAGDMDMNIVIRTLALARGRGFYQTGAGIVHDSTPDREYTETLHKGRALELALRRASSRKK